jgi:cysteine desulfurase family protein (TIGR01976 family)
MLDVPALRRRFPALQHAAGDRPPVYFDGPAGSQVPQPVVDAMADYLLHKNSNQGGAFSRSVDTAAVIQGARRAVGDLFGTSDEREIVFGPNMTTLTFQLSRSLARTWRPGDEVVVTDSDHDANVTPWVMAARDAGCTVRRIAVRADASLDLDDAAAKIGPKTALVAIGAASNLSGTVHPIGELCALAREHGARTYVDAVHYVPHRLTDLPQWDCDFAVASPYKYFGPHAGTLWGRHALLEELEAFQVRPAPTHGAAKWETGTPSFETMAGTTAAVDYLASLGRDEQGAPTDRRTALAAAFRHIEEYEHRLCARLLAGLAAIEGVRVVGIADPDRAHERCPTVSFTHPATSPRELARRLVERRVDCWPGHSYAITLTEALGLAPDGVLRLGILHYNTEDEIDYTLAQLRELLT